MRSWLVPSDECARARAWISLRLDAQLSEFEDALLGAHLKRCADCGAFAETMSDVTTTLRSTLLERPTFAFEPPRRSTARVQRLRVISAAAAVTVIGGLSGLVALELSTTSRAPGAPTVDLKLIGFKERQMDELDGTARRAISVIRPSLASAQQVTVGSAPQTLVPRRADRRISPSGLNAIEGR
jgi:hypothetical protein